MRITRSTLTELANMTAHGGLAGPALRNDADRAVALEVGGFDRIQVVDAVLASGHGELFHIHVLPLDVPCDEFSVPYELGGFALEQVRDKGDAVRDARKSDVHRDERRGRDHPSDEGVVATGHRVLHGVRDDEDDNQVNRAHLPQLALAGDAEE